MPSLKEMLAEQRRAEAENLESLRRHEKTMEDCRRFITDLEGNADRRGLDQFEANSLLSTRQRKTLAAGGHTTRDRSSSGDHSRTGLPALSRSGRKILVRKITLPEEKSAKYEVLEQLALSEEGKRHIFSKDKYQLMQWRQENEIKRVQIKEARYKKLVDTAVEYLRQREHC